MPRELGVAVVVVCHNSADALGPTLRAVRDQIASEDQVVVVDNASRDATVAVAREAIPDAIVIENNLNVGFATGCHVGALASQAPLLLFLNPDARPSSGCLSRLRANAAHQPTWGAWQAVLTLPNPAVINSAGNIVHFLGIGWAGGLGQPADDLPGAPKEVGFASGAALMVRRTAWEAVGGFDERYFMYGEDLDLCLRLRLAGWGIGVVHGARATHDYAFMKGDFKWFYLERNRWWTVLGVYPGRVLALVAPALLASEVGILVAAWRGGWLRAKLRAQGAVVRDVPHIVARRRRVQATRRITTNRFAATFTAELDSPYLASGRAVPGAEWLLALYWRWVQSILRRT